MSRAYEALLVNSMQRLDRWIADTESLASISDDPITQQQIEFDLSRWQASRDRLATLLARTKWLIVLRRGRRGCWSSASERYSYLRVSFPQLLGSFPSCLRSTY